jgi:hypothetical protein
MSNMLLSVVPLALANWAMPLQVIIVVLLLQGGRGVLRGFGFLGGMTAVRLARGILFGLAFIGLGAFLRRGLGAGRPLLGPLLLVLTGAFMLGLAVWFLMGRSDPGEASNRLLGKARDISPGKAFGLGAAFVLLSLKSWLFTLAALGAIQDGQPSGLESFLWVLGYILMAELPVRLPILMRVLAPAKSVVALAAISEWFSKHNRALVIAAEIVFGLFFLAKGITELAT